MPEAPAVGDHYMVAKRAVYVVVTLDNGNGQYPIVMRQVWASPEREEAVRRYFLNNSYGHRNDPEWLAQQMAEWSQHTMDIELKWFERVDVKKGRRVSTTSEAYTWEEVLKT